MIYAKIILLSIAVGVLAGVLLEILLDRIPDRVLNVVFVITMSLLVCGVLLVAFGTITKNRWGINFTPVNCPTCGSPTPRVRRPESLKQTLWGGGTWEVRLRNGQMGPLDYVDPLAVETSPAMRVALRITP